jgi:hypothetical protein
MVDRGFTEVELRRMLQHASKLRRDIIPERWVAVARHKGKSWEIILAPDFDSEVTVVITAYPLSGH